MIFTGTPFRRLLGLSLLVLLLVGVAAGWLAWRASRAQDHLSAARSSLDAARAAIVDREFDAGRAAVARAGEDTRAARHLTGDPVWRLAAAVPFAGNSLQTARGLAVAADDLARGVLTGALDAAEDVDPKAIRRGDGSVDLELLRRVAPGLETASVGVRDVRRDLAQLPVRGLVGPVARGRAGFADQVGELGATLAAASEAVRVAPTLLGADRPRRYLLLVQQTAESRGTGGLPGGFAALEADGGRLRVLSTGSNAELASGVVAAPPDVPASWVDRYRNRASLALWQNVNMSPDLPVVAKVVEARWRAQGGSELDGVIVLDARALASILEGSEPVPLPGGTVLRADEVEEFLAVGQYRGLSVEAGAVTARKERLSEVADVALSRLAGGGGDSVALFDGLSEAVRSGHLRMASDDPALAPVLQRSGVDGGLPRGDAPVAYPVVHNTIGGKLDHWLDRSVTYEADDCGNDFRGSTITTTLLSTPPEDLPAYNTIRIDPDTGAVTQSRVNRVALNVYATRGAVLVQAALDGEPVSTVPNRTPLLLEKGEEAGLPVWTVYVELPPGQERTFVLELIEPTTGGVARVPEQPLSRDLERTVAVPSC